jgi:hypothetical protein
MPIFSSAWVCDWAHGEFFGWPLTAIADHSGCFVPGPQRLGQSLVSLA